MNLSIEERRIKQLFKEALIEVIEKRRSVSHELLPELDRRFQSIAAAETV